MDELLQTVSEDVQHSTIFPFNKLTKKTPFPNERSNSIRVYNCTSSSLNPVMWRDHGLATLKYARKNPTKYMMLYPNFCFRTNRIIHTFYEWFYHFLPAMMFDVLLRLQGTKPFLLKIAKRYKAAADTGM